MRDPGLSRAADPAARDPVPESGRPETGLAGELRDTELAISFWRQKASESDGLPPPSAFDFSRIIGGAWSYRFVLCVTWSWANSAFLFMGRGLRSFLNCRKSRSAASRSPGNFRGDICRFSRRVVAMQSRKRHPFG